MTVSTPIKDCRADAQPGLSPLKLGQGVRRAGHIDDLLKGQLLGLAGAGPLGHDDKKAIGKFVKEIQAGIAIVDELEGSNARVHAQPAGGS